MVGVGLPRASLLFDGQQSWNHIGLDFNSKLQVMSAVVNSQRMSHLLTLFSPVVRPVRSALFMEFRSAAAPASSSSSYPP